MKFIGHRIAFAAAFLALAEKGDDAVGVMRIYAEARLSMKPCVHGCLY